ncbi:sensor histidine kinase [Brevibacillus ginsengisoli]|uniref:sensor histidine kinase n=1 Tax=Brevibacillus ginsengisoli TaxID=363854 RepID=UPI003CF3A50C
MNLLDYMADHKWLFVFYILLMSFISIVIYAAPFGGATLDLFFYIHSVAFLLFCLYFFGGYIRQRSYFSTLQEACNQPFDTIVILPEPKSNAQAFYNKLLLNVYERHHEEVSHLYAEKKETLEFMTSWFHEIKTPLSVSRLLIENKAEKEPGQILDSLDEELDKIEHQIERALYYARIDDFSRDYFIHTVNLDQIVKQAVKNNAKTFISKRIQVKLHDLEHEVLTDKKWLFFILNQILSNALKYTAPEGIIEICGGETKQEYFLKIRDTGIGIPPEDVSRVFEKGFTGSTGRTHEESTGIGLYLARKLAHKLNHDITLQSEYGVYTEVTLHFPKLNDSFTALQTHKSR